jgi:hypothetical protein
VIRSYSDSTYPELIEIERQGHGFFAWGLPGREDHIENWFLMGKGDFVLIGYKGAFRHYAKVLGRYQNSRAARDIWGDDIEPFEQRQYLFFLSEPIPLGHPYAALSDFLPEQFGEFERISDEIVARLEAEFGSVERFIRRRLLTSNVGGPMIDISGMIQLSERELARLQTFDPESGKAGRNQRASSGGAGTRHSGNFSSPPTTIVAPSPAAMPSRLSKPRTSFLIAASSPTIRPTA